MNIQQVKLLVILLGLIFGGAFLVTPKISSRDSTELDEQLRNALNQHGFTGTIQQQLEQRLGRSINFPLSDLGRLAFHDSLLGLNNDNSCAGCHAAPNGFGDTQSIAIGIENNYESARSYNPQTAGVDVDLQGPMGPFKPVLLRVDPLLQTPVSLTEDEFRWLVAFVRYGLLDERATPQNLRRLIPEQVPSGQPIHVFQ